MASRAAHVGDVAGATEAHDLLRALAIQQHGARVEGRSAIMLLQIPAVLYVQAGGVFEQLLTPVAALIPGWSAFLSSAY